LLIQFSHSLLQGFEQEHLAYRDPVILLEGVDSADFEFLGKDEEGGLTGWTSIWEQTDKLPAAVRLNLEFSGELNLRWPDLVAGVKVDEQAVMGMGSDPGQGAYRNAIKDLIKGKKRDEDRS
jgi:general secretion pathway protein J